MILKAFSCIAALMITVQGPQIALAECPTYWTHYQNSCYRYFGSPYLCWRDADIFCKDQGGNLVSIHSDQEQEFVEKYWMSSRDFVPNMQYYNLVRKPFSLLYIGLHDHERDGEFEWTDGSPVDYVHWLPGQPSGGFEDSVMMWDRQDNKNRGMWNDVISITPRLYGPFMCKISFKELD